MTPQTLTANVTLPIPVDPGVFVFILTLLAFFLVLKLFKRVMSDVVFIVALLFAAGIIIAIERVVQWLGH